MTTSEDRKTRVENRVYLQCRKLRLGQFDRNESHDGEMRVTLQGGGRVQLGDYDGGLVFAFDDLRRAVEILGKDA